MKTIARICLLFVIISAARVAADQTVVRVVANSDLRLVIVDSSRNTPAREAMHRAFAASLGKAVGDAVGGPATVQLKCLSADEAAFGLGTGRFHAVLAIGKSLPRPLAVSGLSRLNAALGAGKTQCEAFLVFSNEDPGLQKLLTESFANAITDQRFLDAFDGGIEIATGPARSQALASTVP